MIQLHDIISSSTLKVILLYVIVFLAATVLILFLALVANKLYSEYRARKKTLLKQRYIGILSEYQLNPDAEFSLTSGRLNYEALSEVCIDVLLSISGATADRMKELVRKISVVDYFKKLSGSASWLRRYYAIEKLGFMRLEELRSFFVEFLEREKRYEVRAKVLWALSLIADHDVLHRITAVLSSDASRSSKFNEYLYSNIIYCLRDREATDDFVGFMNELKTRDDVPLIIKRDVVEACGSSGLHEAVSVVAEYFNLYKDTVDMKIAAIRALGKLGGSSAEGVVKAGFVDPDWRVRAVAAGSAYLCHEDVIPSLRSLLYDQVYFVRINASKSLARFGEIGLEALEAEVDSKDRFVRDTVRFILEEKVRYA